MSQEREDILMLIDDARAAGARQSMACNVAGITAKTYQRWTKPDNVKDGRLEAKREPPNKLSEWERQQLLKVANEPEYANLPPCKIVPRLADEGRYLASESTFYRVLKAEKQLSHRHRSKPGSAKKPQPLVATAPNQIYSWDITYLPTTVKGIFLYLYLVMDIYSRKIVGWQVYKEESSTLAGELMTDICLREGIQRYQVTLHSDNGGPMKGATMLATLQQLGVIPSFSRPAVSNDNPYSESLFRTLKYQPTYPDKPFGDLLSARRWVKGFVDWYNHEHLHSAIKFVTPEQRHRGLDKDILIKRTQIYEQAKSKHPDRWSGNIRNWEQETEVHLNPERGKAKAA
jgi:transposase InsO family protein